MKILIGFILLGLIIIGVVIEFFKPKTEGTPNSLE